MGRYQQKRAGDGARVRTALRSGKTSASVLGLASVFALAQGAAAQSVDIPLNYAVNTGLNFGGSTPGPVLILTINVGVNGGTAQAYVFDTGSASFLTPNGVFTGATRLASDVNIETYSGTHTFNGDVYRISASSLKFYAASGLTSGGIFTRHVGQLQRRLVQETRRRPTALAAIRKRSSWRFRCRASSDFR